MTQPVPRRRRAPVGGAGARDAERVRAVAAARLRRRQSCDETTHSPAAHGESSGDVPAALARAREAIVAAAKRLNATLFLDEEIAAEAKTIIGRVEEEIETLRRSGEFKAINRSYRAHRTEASTRAEKIVPDAEWLNKYKADLVRQLAGALRYA